MRSCLFALVRDGVAEASVDYAHGCLHMALMEGDADASFIMCLGRDETWRVPMEVIRPCAGGADDGVSAVAAYRAAHDRMDDDGRVRLRLRRCVETAVGVEMVRRERPYDLSDVAYPERSLEYTPPERVTGEAGQCEACVSPLLMLAAVVGFFLLLLLLAIVG